MVRKIECGQVICFPPGEGQQIPGEGMCLPAGENGSEEFPCFPPGREPGREEGFCREQRRGGDGKKEGGDGSKRRVEEGKRAVSVTCERAVSVTCERAVSETCERAVSVTCERAVVKEIPLTPVPLFNYVLQEIADKDKDQLTNRYMDQISSDLAGLFDSLDCSLIIPDVEKWTALLLEVVSQYPQTTAFTHMLMHRRNATLGVWTVPRGAVVPMHSHPARAVGKMLTGSIQSKNERSEIHYISEGETFFVDENHNLHELTGIAPISTFIEVVFPSYLNSLDCVYYEYCAEAQHFVEMNYPPSHFNTMESPYLGITPDRFIHEKFCYDVDE